MEEEIPYRHKSNRENYVIMGKKEKNKGMWQWEDDFMENSDFVCHESE